MTVAIIRGDARALPLADASCDLVVTSPPYWALRSYQDGGEHYGGQIGSEPTPGEYIDALIDCTREWMRVLKPSGSIWINLGDKYNSAASNQGMPIGSAAGGSMAGRGRGGRGRALSSIPQKSLMGLPWRYALRCIDDLGLTLRAEVVWSKPNGLPESVADRVRRSHEDWFHLTTQSRYYSAIDEIREPASGYIRAATADRGARNGLRARAMADTCNPLGRLPGSVWEIATQPLIVPAELGIDHFAAFPMEWPRRLIKGWCPPGGVVADPFGGTGTTALVASMLGRTGITVDASADYCRLARWRCSDPGERAKALQVDKPPTETAGQAALFGEAS